MKHNKLFARLIVEQVLSFTTDHRISHDEFMAYLKFIRSQAAKNNPYALAIRQLEG